MLNIILVSQEKKYIQVQKDIGKYDSEALMSLE